MSGGEIEPCPACGALPCDWSDNPAGLKERLRQEVINTPETADFMDAVPMEAAHQRERWSVDHDAGKSPFDWFWLIGYLAQKAADAAVRGDAEKAKHHTISTAAALANWHAALIGADRRFQPGITPKPSFVVGRSSDIESQSEGGSRDQHS
ncbi:hypothetical protein [Sphingomonas sp. MMS24-J13]|uniref:hypothetical protein n=1 Tax=Sphingomonas sp. MMS24-J13 TaxID=3238686 RepID=UPI00384C4816